MNILQEGSGPVTIVAVHGIQGTAASWLPVARTLKDQATFIMPNLRGRAGAWRGRSANDYRLPCFAQDLAEAIDGAVGMQPYYLAGWSLGVSIALEYLGNEHTARPPRGLILMSGSPMLCRTRWFVGHSYEGVRNEAAQRAHRLNMSESADHEATAWTWLAIADTDQSALLPRVTATTLVVHGTDDEDCPVLHGQWLARGLPDATLCLIEGAGHGLPSGATTQVGSAISQFITQRELSQEYQ